jgi:hypothetical protein
MSLAWAGPIVAQSKAEDVVEAERRRDVEVCLLVEPGTVCVNGRAVEAERLIGRSQLRIRRAEAALKPQMNARLVADLDDARKT